MSELTQFKRINYFTGFFTTADDWNDGQQYHLEKRKLHNRRLHTPGVIRGELHELRVQSAGGFSLLVRPGAALDGNGNEIFIGTSRTLEIDPADYESQQIYIAIKFAEFESDRVENVETPEYSGYTRISEIPILEITMTLPDNNTSIELARITLTDDVAEISDPADPDNPASNEIDRRFVAWAGSVGIAEEHIPPDLLAHVVQVMVDKRADFAALAGRFPVPSAEDVRHVALTLEIIARLEGLQADQLPDVLSRLAAIEQDVEQEIGARYPGLTAVTEYELYQESISHLLDALQTGESIDLVLTREAEVAEAARNLSEVVLKPPQANAGPDRTVDTPDEETSVILDAAASHAFGDRTIIRYYWNLTETQGQAPVADAGRDRTVETLTTTADVILDAGGSKAFDGKQIVRYRWDDQP